MTRHPQPRHRHTRAQVREALVRRPRRDRTPCSCYRCGNARRHSGPPLQERRLALRDASPD